MMILLMIAILVWDCYWFLFFWEHDKRGPSMIMGSLAVWQIYICTILLEVA